MSRRDVNIMERGRTTSRRKQRERALARRPGFTMVELLVVVTIVGVLMSVAVPHYASYKRKAVDGVLHAVIRDARAATEARYVETGSYAGVTRETLLEFGVRLSDGVDIEVVEATPSRYSIRGCANGGTVRALLFDSETGATTAGDTGCS